MDKDILDMTNYKNFEEERVVRLEMRAIESGRVSDRSVDYSKTF